MIWCDENTFIRNAETPDIGGRVVVQFRITADIRSFLYHMSFYVAFSLISQGWDSNSVEISSFA